MISSLLLPLLVATGPTPLAGVSTDDPPIRLSINQRTLLPGDRAKVQINTEYDGYLLVLHVDPDGRLRVLFPIDPDKDNFARGGKTYEVRGRGGRETFEADLKGRGTVYAAISHDPFRFDGYVVGDHWDYKALAPSHFDEDPEQQLNDLVQRMAQSSFDYDLITYDVVERSAYASDYSRYYGSGYSDPWCYSCGGYYGWPYGFSISLAFGNYYPYYYNRYHYPYAPFYSPFYYSYYPYYPYYYGPAHYYPSHYYYPYSRYSYWDRQRSYGSYTPYRFRTADGFTSGYRDRRYDLRRSVNTVYRPPASRVREPSALSPARRIIAGAPAELPSGTARRVVGQERRLEKGKIEARRARERDDQPRTVPSDARARERQPVEARRAQSRDAGRPHDGRGEPRLERRREEPRAVERSEPRAVERTREEPRRAERAPEARQAPSYDRGGSRGEGRSPGGSRPNGGSRSMDGGGGRRRT
jgi:Domain of unknown function (DUF4384)